jgi:Bacterial SH3 domain
MRALLLLGVVGAVLYELLLVSHHVLPIDVGEDRFAREMPVDRQLRSWGSDLSALVISRKTSLRHPLENAAYAPAPERTSGAAKQSLTSGDDFVPLKLDVPEQEPTEWAKVMLAARVHSEASVSSPTIRYYRPGTELQVVRRESGWVKLVDPATQEHGWIFENYLSSIDGPSRIQAAMDAPTEDGLSEPMPAKPVGSNSTRRNRSAKPAAQVSDDVMTKSELRRGRWARRDNRRRGSGRFGRFARFDAVQ